MTRCQDAWFVTRHFSDGTGTPFVTVKHAGATIRFDLSLKHDTGSGRLVEISSYPDYHDKIPQSIEEVDNLLIKLLHDYRDLTAELLSDLDRSIADLS